MKNTSTVLALLTACCFPAAAQQTAFTYQGRLNDGANPANGIYDLRFTIYGASSGGSAVAGPLTNLTTQVSNGLFTVTLDFGAGVFTGPARWLEIDVRSNGISGFTTLSPRQALSATPYALYADTANAAGLTGALPAGSLNGTYSNPVTFNNGTFAGNGNGLTNLDASQISEGAVPAAALGNAWRVVGNSGTTETNFLGTTDNQPLELKVNGGRALRLEPTAGAPNVIGGDAANGAAAGVQGAAIGGGQFNTVLSGANYGTIGGGYTNRAAGLYSTVAGGSENIANDIYASVGGGLRSRALGYGSTVGGGSENAATGDLSTVPGGAGNAAVGDFSFAAGRRAKAIHDGSFVWADSQFVDFPSTRANQFLIRASGGVGINTNNPSAALHVGGVPGTDGIRYPDGTLQTTAPIPVFASGAGFDPVTTIQFLARSVTVTVNSTNQKILVTSHKALGSTAAGGANNLNLYIGYRPAGSSGIPSTVGNGVFGNRVAQNTRITMGLSAMITGLAPGDYEVGLVGSSSDAANWNSCEYSYTTATVY